MAHKVLIGGGGDYYYGNVKADISVRWAECTANDLADGTSTECANIYGASKPNPNKSIVAKIDKRPRVYD